MTVRNWQRRVGLTLLELVVVITVLALLAALIIPKVGSLLERSQSSSQAFSLADVARHTEVFMGLNRKYPDGWDTLQSASGTLYNKLSTGLSPLLTTATLSSAQLTSLSEAGIGHVFLHSTATGTVPSNSGVDRRHLGDPGATSHDGTVNLDTFAVIDETVGGRGLEILVNEFGLNPNRASTDTTLPRINANIYVAFGLGPKCTLVQSQIHEAPLLESTAPTTTYSRAIAVFEVPNTGATPTTPLLKAKLVGVLGPDGRSKSVAIADYNNINGVQPH